MRLWSLHPKYLDSKGLVALWREALLAKKVLEEKTKGYKNHPQLLRFRQSTDPIKSIDFYLEYIYIEAIRRGYTFDSSKFVVEKNIRKLSVSSSQIDYELLHLLNKLKERDYLLYEKLKGLENIELHPLFFLVEGDIEPWERHLKYEL
jgi:hypothetical protein